MTYSDIPRLKILQIDPYAKYFAQNFETLGLKKLISTSYAVESKQYKEGYQLTLFEEQSPNFDEAKTRKNGKIFVLNHDTNQNGRIDINDLEWHYLEGDGDFRSNEVKALRDEADIIVTNPPFSLFREFLAWIVEADKQFVIIGNMNAITYKEVFPLIKENKLWLGTNDVRWFYQGDVNSDLYEAAHSRWFTNLEHGRRHYPLPLMTMADNIKFSRHKEIKGKEYAHYDNYDAIEVPYTDAIPNDYEGVMGVPISFLDKYCPEQFEILGTDSPYYIEDLGIKRMGEEWIDCYRRHGGTGHLTANMHSLCYYDNDGKPISVYKRILIRKKQ